MSLHKVPLFAWAIFITAILLLLSLPVLAGEPIIVPALNLAVCLELLNLKFTFKNIILDQNLLWTILPVFLNKDNSQVTWQNFMFVRNLNDCAPRLSHKNYISDFGSYLTGLIEGDGTIVVPITERSTKGKFNYASIQIAFPLKDFPLVIFIQIIIEHGSIHKKKHSASYILTINNLDGLIKVVSLINGNIRTPKIHDLNELVKYINKKTSKNLFEIKPLDDSDLFSNAWLTGFIEADGSFQVRTSLKSKYIRLGVSFELTQARKNHDGFSSEKFISKIAKFLFVKLNNIRDISKHPQYRVRTSTLESNLKLKEYLLLYPLIGTKYLDFIDWSEILIYFKLKTEKQHVKEICNLKSQINNERTNFNWDHLKTN